MPARTTREEAPDSVRRLLLDLLEGSDELNPYEELCRYLSKVPEDAWGQEQVDLARGMIRRLEWWQVYELIERYAWLHETDRINGVFAAAGLAYEFFEGEVRTYEPDAAELEVDTIEDEAAETLDPNHRFVDAKAQYRKALEFLRQRPPDLESALSNAVNSIEGAVTVLTGEKTLGAGLKKLYSAERTPLSRSIEQLHNFGSAVPGVRHGAHSSSDLNEHEVRYVVRCAGSALAYLVSASYDGVF